MSARDLEQQLSLLSQFSQVSQGEVKKSRERSPVPLRISLPTILEEALGAGGKPKVWEAGSDELLNKIIQELQLILEAGENFESFYKKGLEYLPKLISEFESCFNDVFGFLQEFISQFDNYFSNQFEKTLLYDFKAYELSLMSNTLLPEKVQKDVPAVEKNKTINMGTGSNHDKLSDIKKAIVHNLQNDLVRITRQAEWSSDLNSASMKDFNSNKSNVSILFPFNNFTSRARSKLIYPMQAGFPVLYMFNNEVPFDCALLGLDFLLWGKIKYKYSIKYNASKKKNEFILVIYYEDKLESASKKIHIYQYSKVIPHLRGGKGDIKEELLKIWYIGTDQIRPWQQDLLGNDHLKSLATPEDIQEVRGKLQNLYIKEWQSCLKSLLQHITHVSHDSEGIHQKVERLNKRYYFLEKLMSFCYGNDFYKFEKGKFFHDATLISNGDDLIERMMSILRFESSIPDHLNSSPYLSAEGFLKQFQQSALKASEFFQALLKQSAESCVLINKPTLEKLKDFIFSLQEPRFTSPKPSRTPSPSPRALSKSEQRRRLEEIEAEMLRLQQLRDEELKRLREEESESSRDNGPPGSSLLTGAHIDPAPVDVPVTIAVHVSAAREKITSL